MVPPWGQLSTSIPSGRGGEFLPDVIGDELREVAHFLEPKTSKLEIGNPVVGTNLNGFERPRCDSTRYCRAGDSHQRCDSAGVSIVVLADTVTVWPAAVAA